MKFNIPVYGQISRILEEEVCQVRRSSSAAAAAAEELTSLYRREAERDRSRAEERAVEAEAARAEAREARRGVGNLVWQLRQKEAQVEALEGR